MSNARQSDPDTDTDTPTKMRGSTFGGISAGLSCITYHRSHGVLIEWVIPDTQHSRQNHRCGGAAFGRLVVVCFRVERYDAVVDAGCKLRVLLG